MKYVLLSAFVALALVGCMPEDEAPAPVNMCKGLDADACAANPECQMEGKDGGEQHCARK